MLWLMVVLGVLFVVGSLLAAMGGFELTDEDDYRRTTSNKFIDWML